MADENSNHISTDLRKNLCVDGSYDEVWASVDGYGGHYEASSSGRIRVKDRVILKRHVSGKMMKQTYSGKILSPSKADKYGHMSVSIGQSGAAFTVPVHRLVLLAFVGPCPDGLEACHNNGVASDNRIENLRWDTHASNNADRLTHGTYRRGEVHHCAKTSERNVSAAILAGLSNSEIMEKLGVSRSQAHRIRTGESWAHLHKAG